MRKSTAAAIEMDEGTDLGPFFDLMAGCVIAARLIGVLLALAVALFLYLWWIGDIVILPH